MTYRAKMRVRFGDIDHGGVVYFPRFLHYFHVAIEDFFQDVLGRPYDQMMNEERFGLPIKKIDSEFMQPLRFGDRIEVELHVEHLGTTSLRWAYSIYKNGETKKTATGKITTVGAHMDTFQKMPLLPWLRSALQDYQAEPASKK